MKHLYFNNDIKFVPNGYEVIYFGMGCFWGAEKLFWNLPNIYSTSVGYSGGNTENPSYEEVCTGKTNHAEVVGVVYDPKKLNILDLFITFWEGHDPTQGMRQGNDYGTQYRSMIITTNEFQKKLALETKIRYQEELIKSGFNKITTEVVNFEKYFFAEEYHQQYLFRNPGGYCGLGGLNQKYPYNI